MINVLLTGLAAVLLGGTTTRADFINQMRSFGPSPVDFTTTFTFNRFDPALGTLNRVIITGTGGITAQVTLTNNGSLQARNLEAVETVFFELDRPGGAPSGPDPFINSAIRFSTAPPLRTLNAGQSIVVGPSSGTPQPTLSFDFDSSVDSPDPAAELAFFTGSPGTPGTVTLPYFTTSSQGINGINAANVAFAYVTNGTGNVTVRYDFTPVAVPEPTSIILSSSGFLALLGYGWRRQRKAV